MTKARTVAAKRRARKRAQQARITLPGGESAPQRPSHPRDRRHTAPETEQDAMRTVTESRIRQAPQHAENARAPMAGEPIGMCILELAEPHERAPLWQTWCAMTAAHRAYRLRYLGATAEPANAALPMLPDPMQTDQSPRVDLRDPDEKVRDAVAGWQRWEARINALPIPMHRWAIRGALDGFGGAHWQDGRPTARGRSAVQALRLLTE